MLSHRARYRLSNFWQSVRPWVLVGIGLMALVSLWYFLANVGPGKAVDPVPDAPAKADDPALLKLAAEVAELERADVDHAGARSVRSASGGRT